MKSPNLVGETNISLFDQDSWVQSGLEREEGGGGEEEGGFLVVQQFFFFD